MIVCIGIDHIHHSLWSPLRSSAGAARVDEGGGGSGGPLRYETRSIHGATADESLKRLELARVIDEAKTPWPPLPKKLMQLVGTAVAEWGMYSFKF